MLKSNSVYVVAKVLIDKKEFYSEPMHCHLAEINGKEAIISDIFCDDEMTISTIEFNETFQIITGSEYKEYQEAIYKGGNLNGIINKIKFKYSI